MIEMKTLSSREKWLEARSNYIGGSDASAVIGLNPYKTNLELWQEKNGLVQPEDISGKLKCTCEGCSAWISQNIRLNTQKTTCG